VDDVAAEADHLHAVFALGELENGRPFHVRPLRLPAAEDCRDPYRGVELLCHDESAHGKVRTQGALFNRLLLDVAAGDSSRARFLERARAARITGPMRRRMHVESLPPPVADPGLP